MRRESARPRAGAWPPRAHGSRSSTSTRTAPREVAESIDGIAYAVDVTDFDALHAAALDAHEQLGGLTLLYNNAGGSSMAAIHDWDLAEWQRIVTLNLTGVFHGFKAVAPLILRVGRRRDRVDRVDLGHPTGGGRSAVRRGQGRGRRAHRVGRARVRADDPRQRGVAGNDRDADDHACCSKTRGLGREEHMIAKTPLARVGTPDDIADVVVFLCSDLARFVTGQNIVIDGGMTLHGSGVDGVLDIVRDLIAPARRPPALRPPHTSPTAASYCGRMITP